MHRVFGWSPLAPGSKNPPSTERDRLHTQSTRTVIAASSLYSRHAPIRLLPIRSSTFLSLSSNIPILSAGVYPSERQKIRTGAQHFRKLARNNQRNPYRISASYPIPNPIPHCIFSLFELATYVPREGTRKI